jgi:hypothetical protein
MNPAVDVLDQPAVDRLRTIYDRDGKLTAESVVDDARDPSSPLHARFDWDDTVAAFQWRLEQARCVIRAAVTVIDEQPVRAFVHVRSVGSYTPVEVALAASDWREEVLAQFRRDADAFVARWRHHAQLGAAFAEWVQDLHDGL